MSVATPTLTEDREVWWGVRRRRYNRVLLLAAPMSGVSTILVWGLFEERLPCLEINGASVFAGVILFVPGWIAANIFYRLGSICERIIAPRNPSSLRRWTYGFGVAFSLLIVFFPPIINLAAALNGPLPCTDKFGKRRGVDGRSSNILVLTGSSSDTRPVHTNTMTNEIKYIEPKARVY